MMTGERWPDKRARAVLFAGAKKQATDEAGADPDEVADLGLQVRGFLFTDEEVREDQADTKAHQIGYSGDCMQFATLQPVPEGLALGLWVGPEGKEAAKKELGAVDDPNPFRSHFGWVRLPLAPGSDLKGIKDWVRRARRHAAENKSQQTPSL